MSVLPDSGQQTFSNTHHACYPGVIAHNSRYLATGDTLDIGRSKHNHLIKTILNTCYRNHSCLNNNNNNNKNNNRLLALGIF